MTAVPTVLDRIAEIAWGLAATLAPRLVLAVIILAAGALVAKWTARAVTAAMAETGRIDVTARPALLWLRPFRVGDYIEILRPVASIVKAGAHSRVAWRSSPN